MRQGDYSCTASLDHIALPVSRQNKAEENLRSVTEPVTYDFRKPEKEEQTKLCINKQQTKEEETPRIREEIKEIEKTGKMGR